MLPGGRGTEVVRERCTAGGRKRNTENSVVRSRAGKTVLSGDRDAWVVVLSRPPFTFFIIFYFIFFLLFMGVTK